MTYDPEISLLGIYLWIWESKDMYKHDYNIIAFNNKYWGQPKYITVVEQT